MDFTNLTLICDRNLDRYFRSPKEVSDFHNKGEHYNLLSSISHRFNKVKLYDIGTYKGNSAVALSSNPANLVISYDIGYYVDVDRPVNVEFRIGNFYYDVDVIKSPFILFDIDPHNGADELEFYEKLLQAGYKGIVLFDDIHLNSEMKYFWNSIKNKKFDLTNIGHWSGTGAVLFE